MHGTFRHPSLWEMIISESSHWFSVIRRWTNIGAQKPWLPWGNHLSIDIYRWWNIHIMSGRRRVSMTSISSTSMGWTMDDQNLTMAAHRTDLSQAPWTKWDKYKTGGFTEQDRSLCWSVSWQVIPRSVYSEHTVTHELQTPMNQCQV